MTTKYICWELTRILCCKLRCFVPPSGIEYSRLISLAPITMSLSKSHERCGKSDWRRLTMSLAYSSSPPIGAKMIPTMKKIGKTVLGVRMGLCRLFSRWSAGRRCYWSRRSQATYCHAFSRCCRKAVSVERQGFCQALDKP